MQKQQKHPINQGKTGNWQALRDCDCVASFSSPIGKIGICITNDLFCGLELLPSTAKIIPPSSAFTEKVESELQCYFRSPFDAKFKFTLPLNISGTPLQRAIWQELCAIPVGSVVAYGTLAKKLSTSPRVIGNACRCNPFPIIIPCHRVVGVNGLCGYAGDSEGVVGGAIEKKRWLLQHEGYAGV